MVLGDALLRELSPVDTPSGLLAVVPLPKATSAVNLEKGAEMGRFLLGSTVVMLFPKDSLAFNPDWSPARPIRISDIV